MRKLILLVSSSLVLSLVPITSAHSVYGGTEVTGTPYVLTLLTGKSVRTSFCSMALISERIVVTAAHCVIKDQGAAPELRWPIENIYVSLPGADVTRDDINSRVHVEKVITEPDFINTWKPEINDRRTQINDIAFLFLEKPLVAGYSIEVASEAEIKNAISSGSLITHFGYGLQTQTNQSHSPWTMQLPLAFARDQHLDPEKVIYTREGPTALCPGDSGGPWYLEVNGVKKIAAVTVAASGCRSNPPYTALTLGTRIYPYLTLMKSSWELFLASEKTLKEEAKAKAAALEALKLEAIAKGRYLIASGCHSLGINAELQVKDQNGDWMLTSPTLGWNPSPQGCDENHPVSPWTEVNLESTSTVRWRFWTSQWEVFGEVFTWIAPTKNPPAGTEKIAQAVKPAKKNFLIKCMQGKSVKVFTRSTNTCPSGWKKAKA